MTIAGIARYRRECRNFGSSLRATFVSFADRRPTTDDRRMLILAIDTSWKQGSLALARGDSENFQLIELAPLTGGAFSAQLIPELAGVLARHGLGKQDLGGLVAVSGPGSFTGLRVGLAAIKGLAEALQKPIATVSGLEAMAIAAGVNGRVMAALDAQRGEIFVGEYDVQPQQWQAISRAPESLLTRADFLDALSRAGTLIACDGGVAELAQTGGTVRLMDRPRADMVARIGLRKLLSGATVTVDELDANYIRRSDAEIFSRTGR